VAVWREGFEGNTNGYTRHPQLDRFREASNPLDAINTYLAAVADEAATRGYKFDRSKLQQANDVKPLELTRGQMEYEWQHLLRKCRARSTDHYQSMRGLEPKCHPLFRIVPGGIAAWERLAD
jgi:hypothetical protein